MGSPLRVLSFDMKLFWELFSAYNDVKCSSGKMAGFQHESLPSPFGENRVLHRIFGALNQIMTQPATFLLFFNIP